jgi:hypothetical protein
MEGKFGVVVAKTFSANFKSLLLWGCCRHRGIIELGANGEFEESNDSSA